MVHGGAFGHIKGFVRPQMSEEKMPQLMHQCGELHGRVVVAVDQHPVLRDLLLGGAAQYPDRTCFLVTCIDPAPLNVLPGDERHKRGQSRHIDRALGKKDLTSSGNGLPSVSSTS